jgi:hypothetical protein
VIGGTGVKLAHCHPLNRMERYRGAKTPWSHAGVSSLLFAFHITTHEASEGARRLEQILRNFQVEGVFSTRMRPEQATR